MLIHRNFVNNNSWTEWRQYYEQNGYKVYTPANTGHEGNSANLKIFDKEKEQAFEKFAVPESF